MNHQPHIQRNEEAEGGRNVARLQQNPPVPPPDPMMMMMQFIQRLELDRQAELRRAAEERGRDRTAEHDRHQALIASSQQNRDAPRLTPFQQMKKGDDIEIFLTGFETHMRNFQVNKRHWTSHLTPILNQQVMEAYSRIQQDQQRDYDIVKTSLYYDNSMSHLRLIGDNSKGLANLQRKAGPAR